MQARAVGPLEVVDEDQRTRAGRRLEQQPGALGRERAPALAIDGDASALVRLCELGEDVAERDDREPRQGAGRERVEGQRLPEERARETPRLVPLGGHRRRAHHRHLGAARELVEEPGLARAARARHEHDPLRRPQRRRKLGLAPGERELGAGDRGEVGPDGGRHQGLAPKDLREERRRLLGGVQPQLLGEADAEALVRLERAGPVSVCGERPDLQDRRRLAERLAARRLRRERERAPGVARLERGRRPRLERDLERVAEPGAERLRPVLVEVFGEWLASPERDGAVELGERGGVLSGPSSGEPAIDRAEELLGVDAAALLGRERVAPRPRQQQARIPERPARARDQHLQVRPRVRRRPERPQGLGEDVLRHVLAAPGDQDADEPPGQPPAERRRRHLLAVAEHGEPPEDAHVERGTRHGTRMLRPSRRRRKPARCYRWSRTWWP